jgi:hypothetical protein
MALSAAATNKLAPRKFRAFVHSGQAMVPLAASFTQNLRIDALSIVPDPHSKLPSVVLDLHFDPPRLCVLERIAQRFDGDPIDFVPDERSQFPRCAFQLHAAKRARVKPTRC